MVSVGEVPLTRVGDNALHLRWERARSSASDDPTRGGGGRFRRGDALNTKWLRYTYRLKTARNRSLFAFSAFFAAKRREALGFGVSEGFGGTSKPTRGTHVLPGPGRRRIAR